MSLRLRVSPNFARDDFDLVMFERNERSSDPWTTNLVTNLEVTRFDDAVQIPNSAVFTVSKEDAQVLMDTLWNAGVRPQYVHDRTDLQNAQSQHIKSLESVVSRLFDLFTLQGRHE